MDSVSSYMVKVNLHLSDHALLEMNLKPQNIPQPTGDTMDNILQPLYKRFVWGTESADKFCDALLTDQVNKVQAKFLVTTYERNEGGSVQALNDFEGILTKAANQCLKVKRPKQKTKIALTRKKGENQPWYDTSCFLVRSEMRKAKKVFERNPFNREIRQRYVIKCSQYKKQLRKKEKQYKDELLKKLLCLESAQPKAFWKLLDKLKDLSSSGTSEQTSAISSQQ